MTRVQKIVRGFRNPELDRKGLFRLTATKCPGALAPVRILGFAAKILDVFGHAPRTVEKIASKYGVFRTLRVAVKLLWFDSPVMGDRIFFRRV
ncbi:MAG: hypothetical protein ABI592_05840 [Acidobacteriota bacterium]